MALTYSNPTSKLSMKAPYFRLKNVDETFISLDDCKNKEGLLVMFICNHCPFVQHIKEKLSSCAKEWMKKIDVVAINANDPSIVHEDSFLAMKKDAKEYNYPFPYLIDETQEVARAYKAECTPDFFLYDKNLMLYYGGRFDKSSPQNNIPVTGEDLSFAISMMLDKKPWTFDPRPSMGCSIKWKKD